MYSYLYAIENNFPFLYVKNTNVLLKLPSTIEDHFKQSIRFMQSEDKTKRIKPEIVKKELKLPIFILVKNTLKSLISSPIATFFYFYIYIWARLKSKNYEAIDIKWEIADSSKKIFLAGENENRSGQILAVMIRRIIYIILGSFIIRSKNKYPNIIILCYHSIADNDWRFSVPMSKFKNQIDYLLARFNPISFSDLEKHLNGKKEIKENSFVLTLDDGYQDNYKLRKYFKDKKIKPALFIMSNNKKANHEELQTDIGFLSNKEIKDLHSLGWDIGCHSATHADFSSLSSIEKEEEIVKAKEKLEKMLGARIKYFSYPKGVYDNKIVASVKKAGYKLAVSMDDKIIKQNSNPFTISRIGVDQTHSIIEFKIIFSRLAIYCRNAVKSLIKYRKKMKSNNHKVKNITEEEGIITIGFSVLQKVSMFFVNRLVKEKKDRLPLPRNIDDYYLVDTIFRPKGDDQYQFGIYKNKKGKKGILKMWDGKKHDGDWFWLMNEIKTYEGLDKLFKMKGRQINNKFPNIRLPRLIKAIKATDQLGLFMELIEGKTLDKESAIKRRVFAFEQVITYFQYLGKLIVQLKLDNRFVKRNNTHTVLIFFYMLLRSAWMYPKIIPRLVSGLFLFLANLPYLIKDNDMVFAHRDLTYMNVMTLNDGRIGVIDFELAVLTNPLYEITQAVTGSWHIKNFWQEFYELNLMKQILLDRNQFHSYKALTIFTAVHRIGTSPKKEFESHYSYLLHGLRLKVLTNYGMPRGYKSLRIFKYFLPSIFTKQKSKKI